MENHIDKKDDGWNKKTKFLFSVYIIQNLFLLKKHKKSCLYKKGKEIIDPNIFTLGVGLGVEIKKMVIGSDNQVNNDDAKRIKK